MSDQFIALIGHTLTLVGVIATIIMYGRAERKAQQLRHEENIRHMAEIDARLESLDHMHECLDKTQSDMRLVREGFASLNQRFTDHLELYKIRHDDLRSQITRERERIDAMERKSRRGNDA